MPLAIDTQQSGPSVRGACAYDTEGASVLQEFQEAFAPDRMEERTTKASRKPRADATRNRDRLLEAARSVFGAGGPDTSLEAVARHAKLGIGTLYRHFPTREALFEAVYRHEVDQLSDYAEALRVDADPVAALRRWLQANVQLVATKKGMLKALALAAHAPSELYAYSFERLTTALGSLLQRAVETRKLRADISAEDLLRTLIGMCYLHEKPGWQATVIRLLDVFVDGLHVPGEGGD